mmetsp:Transcript_28767/g.63376  ORF Transcript_28767/g.63376 Transcript_28767/m.63376 type:complete len:88 (-) Transcript_28767:717-980(-)
MSHTSCVMHAPTPMAAPCTPGCHAAIHNPGAQCMHGGLEVDSWWSCGGLMVRLPMWTHTRPASPPATSVRSRGGLGSVYSVLQLHAV